MRAVFTLITVIFVACISYTLTSFKEIPLPLLETQGNYPFEELGKPLCNAENENIAGTVENYGSVENENVPKQVSLICNLSISIQIKR